MAKAAIAAAVLAVVVCAALGVRWWTHPNVFEGSGDSVGWGPFPVADAALSTTVIFPGVGEEPETVTIDRVTPVFSKNTAKATVSFSICHLGARENPVGAVHDASEYCQDLEPFEPGSSFRYGGRGTDYLIATIAPTAPGIAHLARIEVKYERGAEHLYQRGTESIRADRKVKAT